MLVKYGIWKTGSPEMGAVNALVQSGFAPLTSMILSARGITDGRSARNYLSCESDLPDPFLMKDMDLAAGRVGLAMAKGSHSGASQPR